MRETGAGGPLSWEGLADRLGLAAAPTFALMALLTSTPGGPPHWLCAASPGASALGGMAPMYVLMSLFHARPWLRLLSRRVSGRAVPPPVARSPTA